MPSGRLCQAERFKNLLNWSSPAKTGVVLATLLLALAVLAAVPTRYLLLARGLLNLAKVT